MVVSFTLRAMLVIIMQTSIPLPLCDNLLLDYEAKSLFYQTEIKHFTKLPYLINYENCELRVCILYFRIMATSGSSEKQHILI